MSTNSKSTEQIAYELWEARGRPHGSPEQDWHAAENLAAQPKAESGSKPDKVEAAIADSFPASDPPASHIPDVPPSNADAKWAAARGEQASRPRK
jgi:hypothetical protein